MFLCYKEGGLTLDFLLRQAMHAELTQRRFEDGPSSFAFPFDRPGGSTPGLSFAFVPLSHSKPDSSPIICKWCRLKG